MIKFNPAPLFQPRVEKISTPPPRLSTPPPKEKCRPPHLVLDNSNTVSESPPINGTYYSKRTKPILNPNPIRRPCFSTVHVFHRLTSSLSSKAHASMLASYLIFG